MACIQIFGYMTMHAVYIYIIYAVMFVNDSPRLEGNSVTAEFTISRAANLIECGITGRERVDCEYIHVRGRWGILAICG